MVINLGGRRPQGKQVPIKELPKGPKSATRSTMKSARSTKFKPPQKLAKWPVPREGVLRATEARREAVHDAPVGAPIQREVRAWSAGMWPTQKSPLKAKRA